MKEDFKYKCDSCGQIYNITKNLMLCPECREENIEGKPLKGILKVQLPARLKNTITVKKKLIYLIFFRLKKNIFPQLVSAILLL